MGGTLDISSILPLLQAPHAGNELLKAYQFLSAAPLHLKSYDLFCAKGLSRGARALLLHKENGRPRSKWIDLSSVAFIKDAILEMEPQLGPDAVDTIRRACDLILGIESGGLTADDHIRYTVILGGIADRITFPSSRILALKHALWLLREKRPGIPRPSVGVSALSGLRSLAESWRPDGLDHDGVRKAEQNSATSVPCAARRNRCQSHVCLCLRSQSACESCRLQSAQALLRSAERADMSNRLVSIVIPCLNVANTIERLVESLRAQQLPAGVEIEIVTVDNGSTDGTAELLRCLPVRIIEEAKRGPAAARNAGVRGARGEVIVFLDADMRAAHNRLIAEHLRTLDRHTDAGISGGAMTHDPEQRNLFAYAENATALFNWHDRLPVRELTFSARGQSGVKAGPVRRTGDVGRVASLPGGFRVEPARRSVRPQDLLQPGRWRLYNWKRVSGRNNIQVLHMGAERTGVLPARPDIAGVVVRR